MPTVHSGRPFNASGLRFGIVVSRYNESITGKLLDGAVDTLEKAEISEIEVAWVPGAWELSLIAHQMANDERFHAVICLGAVIRGETTHDQHINRAVSLALSELAIRTSKPIAFGLLTCESMEQAIHRSGGNVGNKGVESAEAALEMVSLQRNLFGKP